MEIKTTDSSNPQRFFIPSDNSEIAKQKLYDTGLIPDGLLDHEIFSRFTPKFEWLYDYLQRNLFPLSTLHLDYKQVWPLVALMGMEEALKELIKDNPTQKDLAKRNALYFLVKGQHREIAERHIQEHYPNFNWQEHLYLIEDAAFINNDQSTLNWLMQKYAFRLWSPNKLDRGMEVLFGTVRCGYQDLFWQLVVELSEAGADFDNIPSLPIMAAAHQHWDLCIELIDKGFELSEKDKGMVACHAAKHSLARLKTIMNLFKDIDFREFRVGNTNVYTSACEGGNFDVVNYLLDPEQHWFTAGEDYLFRNQALGALIALKFGHLKLFDHLVSTFGDKVLDHKDNMDRDIFDYIAMSGNWATFQSYATSRGEDWIPPIIPGGFITDPHSSLNLSIRNGHIYFCQQFVKKYGTRYLEEDLNVKMDALHSKNPIMDAWTAEQTKALVSEKAPSLNN